MMPSSDSKNVKISNDVQIQDTQTNSLEQQSEQASLPTSFRKQKGRGNSTYKKFPQKQQSSFVDDLIKMIQISLIVVLVIFVSLMSYAIVNQIKEFWFQSQARQVSISNLIKKDEPMIKMQLTKNDQLKKQQNLQNIHQKEVQMSSQKIIDQQKQLELALTGDTNQNQQLLNTQTIVQLKESADKIKTVTQNQELKQNSNQNIQSQMKPQITQNLLKNVQQDNHQNIQVKQPTHVTSQQQIQPKPQVVPLPKPALPQKNKKPQISAHTIIPQNAGQIYDPVLVQIDKMRKKAGKNYRQTIFTMRNTQITEQQYKMAKQLIEITQYYNAKKRKFDVKNSQISQYKCNQLDPECKIKQKQIEKIVSNEKNYYLSRYRQSWRSITQQLPFCIIVPSYKNNHQNNIFKNLNSIFQQQYSNYHIVYIDDNSKDGTAAKVKDYRTIYDIQNTKLTLLVNNKNQKALSNIYKAAHYYCKKQQIMLIVDGDDYLIGTQVLKLLNFQYQTKKLLAAYTNYLRINQPYYVKVGTSTPYPKTVIDKRTFRKNFSIFRASHLRSFYVDLFRKIKQSDLQDADGNFFTAANDFAIMMPILEMAAPHVQYIPQLTYLYDSGTGLNNFQSKQGVQAANAKIIAKRNIYPQVNIKDFY